MHARQIYRYICYNCHIFAFYLTFFFFFFSPSLHSFGFISILFPCDPPLIRDNIFYSFCSYYPTCYSRHSRFVSLIQITVLNISLITVEL